MTKHEEKIILLLLLLVGCRPDIDTEDAFALCDWIQANDPVDCSVEECVAVVCLGDNVDANDCEPVVEASEEAVHQVTELSHRGLPGTRCYFGTLNADVCADVLVDCDVDAYY